MADSGHSDKSSSEQSNCDEDRGKPRDGSTSPSRRRHKKSKHSKKKSKKKSSKRKRRRDRSRSRSREKHSEKGKKLRDGSSSEKDQADVKTDSRLQTDKPTNEEASLDATANEEVACVASANQNGVETNEPANHEVVQSNFASTLVIKNKPQSPDTKHETFTNKNWQNKSESSFINKTETIEHDLSLNTNLEEIYDPGLYIAKAKEENDSERTTKESDSAKDEQSELKAKAGRKKSSSKTRDHKRSKSRDRKRSRSLERRRFVSGYHSNSRFRQSRSPDRRRRSRSKSPGRRRSRSPERRRRSRSRSLGRRRRSRSRSLGRRRRSRSRSLRRRRRSKSRSPGRRRRSRSPGRRRDDHSRSRTPRKTDQSDDAAASVPVNLTIALGLSTNSVTTTTASVKPGRSIADFTALCKKLTEDKEEKNEIKVENEKVSHVYHPFSVKPAKEIVIPPVILPVAKPTEPARPLEQAFPVSSGNQHKTKEDTNESVVQGVDGSVAAAEQVFQTALQQEKLDVSGLVAKRMEAQNRLQSNPHDFEAKLVLEEVQMKIQNWASVNLKPGQYTGESLVSSMMPKENINSGYQAWAKKNMFHNLAPIRGGVGMKLLQKMGWRPGQVLGKRGEGSYEPIALNVKTDRKGLVSFAEAGAKGKGGGRGGGKNIMAAQAVQGKHPVSALAELCTKRRWQTPAYNIVHESGPAHKKDFLYQVIVNGNSYQHNVASNNKKLAKAEAAFAALKALGVVPADAVMSL